MGFAPAFKILIRPVMYSAGIAIAAILLIYSIGVNAFGASMGVTIAEQSETLGAWDIAWFGAMMILFGGLVAVGLLAIAPKSGIVFAVISMAVFSFSLFAPLAGANDIVTAITLIMMHVSVLAPVLVLVVPNMVAPPSLETL